jgi:hypothetical protein
VNKVSKELPDRETIKSHLRKYREKILEEVHSANNLMSLLMIGTQRKWTRGERGEIKTHFIHLSKTIPAIMVFLLPGGFIFLPLLIELLDRRKKNVPVVEERRRAAD